MYVCIRQLFRRKTMHNGGLFRIHFCLITYDQIGKSLFHFSIVDGVVAVDAVEINATQSRDHKNLHARFGIHSYVVCMRIALLRFWALCNHVFFFFSFFFTFQPIARHNIGTERFSLALFSCCIVRFLRD